MVRFFMDTNQWLLPCVCQGTSADLLLKLRAIEQPSSPARAPGTRQLLLTNFLCEKLPYMFFLSGARVHKKSRKEASLHDYVPKHKIRL